MKQRLYFEGFEFFEFFIIVHEISSELINHVSGIVSQEATSFYHCGEEMAKWNTQQQQQQQ